MKSRRGPATVNGEPLSNESHSTTGLGKAGSGAGSLDGCLKSRARRPTQSAVTGASSAGERMSPSSRFQEAARPLFLWERGLSFLSRTAFARWPVAFRFRTT